MVEEGLDAWTRRLSARAQVEAIEGYPLPWVEEFREKWLPSGRPFEDREAARTWLDQMASNSGRLVRFSFDDQDEAYEVRAGKDAFFEDLDEVAEKLVKITNWVLSSLRAWLITKDARPIVIAVDIDQPHPDDPVEPGLAGVVKRLLTPKVKLEVTLDTPPKVVMDYYIMAQRLYEEEWVRDLPRGRAMAEWTLELVTFAVTQNDGRGWPQLLVEWNSAMPKDWHFESSKQINLATRKGYRTLMGRELDWQGPSIRPAKPRKGDDE